MTIGMKVSKIGKDVLTCTEDELIMSSELNAIKVAHSAATGSSGSYSHGLGYAPAFFVANSGFFVGQDFSNVEATFFSTSTIFYYYNTCRYFLFHQATL